MSALLEMKEAGGKLLAKRNDLTKLMDKKTADGKLDWQPEDHDSFKTLNEACTELHDEYKKWEDIYEASRKNEEGIAELKRPLGQHPMGNGERYERQPERKTIGQLVIESPNYLAFKDRGCSGYATIKAEDYGVNDFGGTQFKTTMSTSAGFAPFIQRTGDIVPFAIRRPTVQDLMPSIQASENAIKYMEETTRTANAAPVAEGATKPESARVYTERTVLIETIATLLPVTEQQLADVPMIMGLINSSLGMEVELAEEDQILGGNGTSPQLQGFLTKTGVQTQAVAGDPVPTAFMKALTLIRFTGFAEPSAAVWHPNDWQDVVTLQDNQGRYIFGDPSSISIKQIWGVPAVVTPAETENTVLVGDFRLYAYVVRRMGLRIDVGYVNDNFAKNLRTIRAETRLALVIRRPAAFAKLTGA